MGSSYLCNIVISNCSTVLEYKCMSERRFWNLALNETFFIFHLWTEQRNFLFMYSNERITYLYVYNMVICLNKFYAICLEQLKLFSFTITCEGSLGIDMYKFCVEKKYLARGFCFVWLLMEWVTMYMSFFVQTLRRHFAFEFKFHFI